MSGAAVAAETVGELFAATVAEYENEPALRTPDGSVAWTWGDYGRAAAAAAAGLATLGVGRGSVVSCWLTNRPEFHAADMGAALLGAASFSIYPTYTAEQAAHVVGDAGSTVLVTESAFVDRALEVLAAGGTALETIVCLGEPRDGTVSWDDVLAGSGDGARPQDFPSVADADDLLTIIYTSGTTGPPKGVQLTHRNVLMELEALAVAMGLGDRMRVISYLPMAHIAERLVTQYLPIAHGWQVTTCADARTIGALLPQVRPDFFFSPPRVWEKFRASALAEFDGDQSGVVAAKDVVLARLGLDAVRVAIVGAAPCPPEVIRFWDALDIPLCEVYGLSETTGLATVNRPDAIRVGTVGTALPGVEVRLSDVGEVLVRGPVIMTGYRNLPDATTDAIDPDGWLHTGDLGTLDDDGYLKIVDRIKELIISAAGKNMSPINIEAALKSASPLIGVPVCIGDARPYNTALITLDPAVAGERAADDPALVRLVQSAVDAANDQLSRVEQIKRFVILDGEWQPGGDELTPTSKLKRRAIAAKYASEIEAMYPGP